MPIPKPKGNESRSKFVSRCMGDPVMIKEYPNEKQRAAICNGAYDQKNYGILINVLTARGWSPCRIKAEIDRIDKEREQR